MNDKHTPGPWTVLPLKNKYYGTKIAIGDHCTVSIWGGGDGEPSEREIADGWEPDCGLMHAEQPTDLANARLIAAAPDLLEALKYAVEALDSESPDIQLRAAINARAVIAKAKKEIEL